ncbi:hypothetical protein [Janthinobacterium lividum]|uniref:hypothetical protein n=1 Tax=Janthinobacterium lividum TaxID=29581 RepID=UPI00140C8352|nr:hypothetical protein [Janthinobacterium lividum]NHQ94311.1 hypothetical protein [Janthinobacterium lividum]
MQDILGFPCFSMDRNGVKFFGFSEYLAALALMVVAWTIADIRYKFRISTAAFPILNLSYFLLSFVGVATLVTDFWRAGSRCVIAGDFITPSGWQGVLGAIFLFVFLVWAWFAFISPSKFGRWNGGLYWKALHRTILKSNADECRVIGEELGKTASSLVRFAWTRQEYHNAYSSRNRVNIFLKNILNRHRFHANNILALIGDARFCKYLVHTSSVSALEIFRAMVDQKRFDISINVFIRNITIEAIQYKDSFVYNEVARYANGYFGSEKTFTTILYGNYELIESSSIVYQAYSEIHEKWSSDQWNAYFRLVLMTAQNFSEVRDVGQSSRVLSSVMNGLDLIGSLNVNVVSADIEWYKNEDFKIFEIICEFLKSFVNILSVGNSDMLGWVKVCMNNADQAIYDDIARAIYKVIVKASSVKGHRDYCYSVQYGTVWNSFFGDGVVSDLDNLLKFKIRRMIYDEVVLLQTVPNFEGANLLAMLMNVCGLVAYDSARWSKEMGRFHKLILRWLQRNYVSLALRNQEISKSCLVEGIVYDPVTCRLIKTFRPFSGMPGAQQILLLESPVL